MGGPWGQSGWVEGQKTPCPYWG